MVLPVTKMQRSALLTGQENGKLDPGILTTLPGQAGGAAVTLVHPAARSYAAMVDAALGAGHVLRINAPSRSYRTYAEQSAIWHARMSRTPIPGQPSRLWNGDRWWLKPGEAVVAPPGRSNHGWASAFDGNEQADNDPAGEPFDGPTMDWLLANTHRFGWSWEIQSEPWHLWYFAGDDIPQAVLDYEASLEPPAPEPVPAQEDDPPMLFQSPGGAVVLQRDGSLLQITLSTADTAKLTVAQRKAQGTRLANVVSGLPPESRSIIKADVPFWKVLNAAFTFVGLPAN